LAEGLAERFLVERRSRQVPLAHAHETLQTLRRHAKLVLVTNGASCLQREKLSASSLDRYFDQIVVSGDIGVGKPDSEIFVRALNAAGVQRTEAVMVGDNLDRDIQGARRAGVAAIWFHPERASSFGADAVIGDLAELSDAIQSLTVCSVDAWPSVSSRCAS
jgi:putative hydrolase of the HAD superfamily